VTTHHEHGAAAGQGPVLVDVGGDVGALVVTMPPRLEGVEVEIRPVPWESGAPLRHVAVVARPTLSGRVHSAVFGGLPSGRYELYLRPDGPVQVTVDVPGGEVAFAAWPD
jgi:hypothetical protein